MDVFSPYVNVIFFIIISKIESQEINRYKYSKASIPFLGNSIRNSKHNTRRLDRKKLIKVGSESKSLSREGKGGAMESASGGNRGGGCVDGVNVRSQGARGRVISCESVNDT